ncbi:hypothetical protein [Paracoccus aminovorans]|nr:hypothetical protein [Paracoccus aminovorans]
MTGTVMPRLQDYQARKMARAVTSRSPEPDSTRLHDLRRLRSVLPMRPDAARFPGEAPPRLRCSLAVGLWKFVRRISQRRLSIRSLPWFLGKNGGSGCIRSSVSQKRPMARLKQSAARHERTLCLAVESGHPVDRIDDGSAWL